MKIKTKLIISFCIIIFVPSILAIATISAYCNFQSHVIEQTYGIKNADAYSIINSVPLLNRYTALDFEKIKKTIKLSPSKMEDAFYLTEINEDLKQKYSYLVVRSERKFRSTVEAKMKRSFRNFRDMGKTVPGRGWTNISTGMMKFW